MKKNLIKLVKKLDDFWNELDPSLVDIPILSTNAKGIECASQLTPQMNRNAILESIYPISNRQNVKKNSSKGQINRKLGNAVNAIARFNKP